MLTDVPGVASGPAEKGDSGLENLARSLSDQFATQESYVTDKIRESVKPDSHLMRLPTHITDQFDEWDAKVKTQAEAELIEAVKKKILAVHEMRTDYIRDKVNSNAEKMRLEFSVKAISKTTSGIQQLLSAQ